MMQIGISVDLTGFYRMIGEARRQIPFATALALTRTAQDVKAGMVVHMATAIDRPRKFTLNSLYVERAEKTSLRAQVYDRFFAAKGTPASKYLAPLIEGGPRGPKRFEKSLRLAGVIGSGDYAVPAKGYPLDAEGNIPGPTINSMLTALRASRDGYQNMTAASEKRRRRRGAVWFVQKRAGRPILVKRTRGAVTEAVLAIVRQPTYGVRLDFRRVAEAVIARSMKAHFEAAAAHALRTAR